MPPGSAERRWSSSSNSKERFPTLEQSPYSSSDYLPVYGEDGEGRASARTPSPSKKNSSSSNGIWQHRKDRHGLGNGHISIAGSRHYGRQKSISDAIRTIRTRKGSVSANAHELAEALKAPLSIKLVVSCFPPILSKMGSDLQIRFYALYGT